MKVKVALSILCFLVSLACKETPKQAVDKESVVVSTPKVKEVKSTFEDLDGNPVELSDFKGKRILLNFWATWCKPCIEEMPALLGAEEILEKDGYVFLLASDQSMDKIKAFRKKKGFDFNYLKFNGVMADFDVNALPATFIFNEAGNQMKRIDGATEWDNPKVIAMLRTVE